MAVQTTPYAIPSLLAALVSVLLVAHVWRHRDERLARVFFVLMIAIATWSLTYAIQLSHTTLAEQLFWQRLGLSIGATIPTVWLAFAAVYAGEEDRLTRPILGLLLVDPVLFAVLAWTNGTHGLLWSSATLSPGLGLDLTFTPAYLVHISYAYFLVLAGIGLMVAVYLRSSAIYRRQAGLLVLGAAIPLLANVAFTLGVSPVRGLDLTTPTFALTGVVFALGLFRFDLLDLTPVARRRVLEEFGSGILVADDRGRVVHANGTAREVLPGAVVGSSVTELLSVEAVADVDGLVSRVDVGDRRRYHEFSVSTLRDFRDRPVGHVIALRDVTTDREYEQRLEVTNRLLRHNLRNDMTKILGWADVAREGSEEDVDAALDEIVTVAEEVAEMSEKAKQIETTLDAPETSLVTVDAVAVIKEEIADVHGAWPESEITLSVPEIAPVRVPGERLLATAIRNLVENGLEHNDHERPTVSVEVRTDSESTIIAVADDGPGIPAIERTALSGERETPLEHGSGLGLWLVHWITQTAGGTLDVEANDPRGSVVTMRLRTA